MPLARSAAAHVLPLLVLGALGAAAPGCGGGGSGGGAATAAGVASGAPTSVASTAAPAASPPAAPAARWWAGDFHVHTAHSGDGVDSVRQTRELARLVGLDLLALTDHSTLTQANDPEFVSTPEVGLVAGYEWTDLAHLGLIGARTTRPELHAQALPPAAWPAYVQSVVDAAHAEGGAAILYHPTWNQFPWLLDVRGADAVEVWNSLWTISDIGLHPSTRAHVERRLRDHGLAAAGVVGTPEVLVAVTAPGGGNDRALAYWEALLARGDRVAAVGGSDRHKVLPPGYPTTWVLAPSRSREDVVAALRAGRTVVTRSPTGPRVTLEADADGDGVFEAGLGDTLPAGRPATLRVRVVGADRGRVRVLVRRRALLEAPLASADVTLDVPVTPAAGDWLRVEVDERVDWALPAGPPLLAAAAGNVPAGGVHALFSAFGVTLATGTAWPAVALDAPLLRMANVTLLDPTWSRAALTSPIYVR